RASRANEKDLPGLSRSRRHADQSRREVAVAAGVSPAKANPTQPTRLPRQIDRDFAKVALPNSYASIRARNEFRALHRSRTASAFQAARRASRILQHSERRISQSLTAWS